MDRVWSESEELQPDEVARLSRGLTEFARPVVGSSGRKELSIMVREEGQIVAGLVGHTHWNWLYIKLLWVSENQRGQKWGLKLMKRAEKIAVERGMEHASVDTFSFQAVDFYEKCGYRPFGALKDYPKGADRIFFEKRDLKDHPIVLPSGACETGSRERPRPEKSVSI